MNSKNSPITDEPLNADDRLDSWKEIATYLRRNERTVSRWEKRGLPVYRVPGAQRQMVFAYKHELDAWLRKSKDADEVNSLGERASGVAVAPMPESPSGISMRSAQYRLIIVSACAMILIVCALGFFSHTQPRRRVMARVELTANAVQAFDDGGHVLWAHNFSHPLAIDSLSELRPFAKLARIISMGASGGREAVVTVPVSVSPNPADGIYHEIDCFSDSGRLVWSYIAHEKFYFGKYELEGPWLVTDVFISSTDTDHPAIWVALTHNRWGNSFVIQLDPATGKDSLRFVNTGVLVRLNEIRTLNKWYLLAAGFNNEYASGILAVLDESTPLTVSPQTNGTRHQCVSCSGQGPEYYFVFPRSEINRLRNLWEDTVHFITVHGEEIEIEKAEIVEPGPNAAAQVENVHTVYLFHSQPKIAPFSLRFDSQYDMLHRELESEHKLNHSIEACPERMRPKPIRVWTPSAGWTRVQLNQVKAVD